VGEGLKRAFAAARATRKPATRTDEIKAVYPDVKILEKQDAKGLVTYALASRHGTQLTGYHQSVNSAEWELVEKIREKRAGRE
jgi:predicted restriction endonuclease